MGGGHQERAPCPRLLNFHPCGAAMSTGQKETEENGVIPLRGTPLIKPPALRATAVSEVSV